MKHTHTHTAEFHYAYRELIALAPSITVTDYRLMSEWEPLIEEWNSLIMHTHMHVSLTTVHREDTHAFPTSLS